MMPADGILSLLFEGHTRGVERLHLLSAQSLSEGA